MIADQIRAYQEMFEDCGLVREKLVNSICSEIMGNKTTYESVENLTQIPWPLISAIHFRECSLSFKRHLHNGDPLSERTVHAPRGRPALGNPPFLWAESAYDALSDFHMPSAWDIPNSLHFLESYNGFGYRLNGIDSPYLWGFTNYYTKGLYLFDGKLDPNKIDPRPGCVAILKGLERKGASLDFTRLNPSLS